MVMRRGFWSRFAENHSITLGQLAIVDKIIARHSTVLEEAVLKQGETSPESVTEEMTTMEAELAAEKNGSHIEK